jgi:hypothetical protein
MWLVSDILRLDSSHHHFRADETSQLSSTGLLSISAPDVPPTYYHLAGSIYHWDIVFISQAEKNLQF